MQWYYAQGRQRIGPISEDELNRLVASGTIGDHTLVWGEGMADWVKYSLLSGDGQEILSSGGELCSECGRPFKVDQMFPYGERRICVDCKPLFLQKIMEGVSVRGDMEYGGFWIRAGAKIIDWMILGVLQFMFSILSALLMSVVHELLIVTLMNLVQIAVAAGYNSYFLGRYGATIGKMACRLKVVTGDGEPVSYLRGLGRYFAEIVSGMLLGIGYFMAGFDDQKRTLHDRICNTLVVKKR